jgi:myosin heavy subunit
MPCTCQQVDLESNVTSKMESMNEESLSTVENMVRFKHLREPSILHNLRERFAQDEIYTSVGDILVAVNPFKMLPIYTPAILDEYKLKGAGAMPPHVYGVADEAYKAMVATGQSQACIVSGESGAGKTETTKLFLQFITDVSVGMKGKRELAAAKSGEASAPVSGATQCPEADLQEQILKANPLMEAFGNAKTSRNDNSSRYVSDL